MSLLSRGSDAISPTAHYTGEVWRRAGLSDPRLATLEGRVLHGALRPVLAAGQALGVSTLEDFLLARHRMIDTALEAAIAAGEIGQVVEVAAGMSPRGLRFVERHRDLGYVEADLPAMARRKREAIDPGEIRHRVVELDALADAGPDSLAELASELDPGRGLAIVTEGLLNYFAREQVGGMLRRFAATLSGFPQGLYVTDIHLGERNAGVIERGFLALLSAFVRGRVHMPYRTEAELHDALLAAGFDEVALRSGAEVGGEAASRVHVVIARCGAGSGER